MAQGLGFGEQVVRPSSVRRRRQGHWGPYMLIGIDASRSVAAQRTGTENYSLFLIRALLRVGRGHRYRLYFNQPPAPGLFERSALVEWRVIPFPRLWTHLRLAAELALSPPDVLFVPSHVLPLLHPRRSVATVHDLGYRHYPEAHTRWSRWYLEWSTQYNARHAARLIVDSRATQRDLETLYRVPSGKMVLAYPAGVEGLAPVRDARALAEVLGRYGIQRPYYLHVGTLQPRKNLSTLLRAFQGLIECGDLAPDVRLVLAGRRGWLSDDILKAAASPALADRVALPGYVPAEDLPALLSGALAYVLPSWHEGFGLPVLEAMACETPVICSNVASLPEVAGDAALLFDPHDGSALADAMLRVYREPSLRETLVARGRAQAAKFTWEACAQRVLGALEAVYRAT